MAVRYFDSMFKTEQDAIFATEDYAIFVVDPTGSTTGSVTTAIMVVPRTLLVARGDMTRQLEPLRLTRQTKRLDLTVSIVGLSLTRAIDILGG